MDDLTISEVAARTGFTPSALRFYEHEGLIAPSRTDAGYRVYDERSIERLRFVSRAKQLGLTLSEITELLTLWDQDDCAPVASRMQDLLAAKVAGTQARIAELVALQHDLERFGTRIGETPARGRCGDDCACHAEPEPVAIACTLPPEHIGGRVSDWQAILACATHREPVPGGFTARFPVDAELAANVGALAAAEQACCAFFTFVVRIDNTGTELTLTAPSDAALLVDALFEASA